MSCAHIADSSVKAGVIKLWEIYSCPSHADVTYSTLIPSPLPLQSSARSPMHIIYNQNGVTVYNNNVSAGFNVKYEH